VFSKNRNRKGDRDMSIASVLSQPTIITSSQTTTAEEQTAEDLALEQAEKEKVDFLNILLTQLSNQNPLDPMDTKDFTAQLTRYSILEQGIETNQKLSVTNDLLQTSASAASFDYIGKQVEVETNIGVVQNDEITWSYLIEGSASDVHITVTDEDGNTVGESEGSISAGVQSATLDTTGYNVPAGTPLYINIVATDQDGAHLNTQVTSSVVVDGVWSDGQNSYLTAGDVSFRSSDVLKLVEAENNETNI
jgi:flagellar basal-body rod modification protein FlgD